ncbi:hypothetical protein [Geobacillus stearothermophilus]|uniref:Uncharacterized protein n=1 Tax=Geobacillus stearothermophilus TaxID=1422 RepID=A0A150MUQ2_GEOSE|nr:hypothetical protein [Geobacillus stearothermophilus]KYD28082.1 hypothetical protein B4109_1214 [Geobacillus stearothermophilus]
MLFCPYGTVIKREEDLKRFVSRRNKPEVKVERFTPSGKDRYCTKVEIVTTAFSVIRYEKYFVAVQKVDDGFEVVNVRKMRSA